MADYNVTQLVLDLQQEVEEWRAIPEYEGFYDVSDQGMVRSLINNHQQPRKTPKMMSCIAPRIGYPCVHLHKNGNFSKVSIHRLVMLAFVGKCPIGNHVNHIDGNKSNNNINNLEYVTPSENALHSYHVLGKNIGDKSFSRMHPERLARGDRNGLRLHPERAARGDRNGMRKHPEKTLKGMKNGCSRLTDDEVRQIRAAHSSRTETIMVLSRKYQVSATTIKNIVYFKKWKHIH